MSGKLAFDHYPFTKNELPRGWAMVSVGQIAKLIASGFPSGAHNQDRRGMPHVRPMNIDREGRLDLSVLKFVEGKIPRELERGDVLFNNTNSPELIGKTTAVLIEGRFAYSNHMTRVQLEVQISPAFVARQLHFLWMAGYFRHRCVNHVNQASISADPLSETVPVLLPPADEQSRIADALDELFSDLDAAVGALERVREKLKLYRVSVLKAAVEGALTAGWRAQHPHPESASQLLKRIRADRRNHWEEDQLAKFKTKDQEPTRNWKAKYKEPVAPDTTNLAVLPAGWCWATVDQLGDVGTGATPNRGMKARYYDGGSVPWVTSSCVNATVVREPSEYVTALALKECNLTLYPPGALLLAMYGEGKTRGMCAELAIDSTTNQALAAIQASGNVSRFLKVFLLKHYHDLRRAASGGVQPNLNLQRVREIAVPLPPSLEQEAIVEAVEDQLSVIDHLEADIEAKLKKAKALRQSILRRAFTGKLVSQDPNDEPASELLKRIAAERALRTGALAKRKQTRVGKSRNASARTPFSARH